MPPRREYSLVVSNAGSEVDFGQVVNPRSNNALVFNLIFPWAFASRLSNGDNCACLTGLF